VIKSRRIIGARHVGHFEEMKNAYKMLFGNLQGKRLFGKPRRRWVTYRNRMGRCGLVSDGSGQSHLRRN
jgi:hypothetical protein